MNKINNKGFTLIEILAVIAIIAIIGLIAIPNVISSLNTSKQASYDILVENITISSKQIYEELEFTEGSLFFYNVKGGKTDKLLINDGELKLNLQTLVSNGFLTGTNNSNNTDNTNSKIITNPKNKEDIGDCEITITKTIDETTFSTSYKIENNSTTLEKCPKTEEYEKVLK